MPLENSLPSFVQGRFDRAYLDEYLIAVFVVLHHFDETAHLPLYPFQAVYNGRVIHASVYEAPSPKLL